MSRNIRAGFVLNTFSWTGGRNYLRNLFSALERLPNCPVTPVVFAGNAGTDDFNDLPGADIVRSSIFDRKTFPWLASRIAAKVASKDLALAVLLRKHDVDLLSHSFLPGVQPSPISLAWIPDFQHLHLPNFFPDEECRQRDQLFMDLCKHCDRVIVSSDSAGEDLQTFAPQHAHKARLLQFVASPLPLNKSASLTDLEKLYDFQGRYFLLPNQFWAHKNHRVVIDALRILKDKQTPMFVMCTGNPNDSRNPTFFQSLMDYAVQSGVQDDFRVLGIVPFDHLIGLMRYSVAFINPSTFEGWSTTVEEAKSMGKRIILSDIPVHCEQAPPFGTYFPPNDAHRLAEVMLALSSTFDVDADLAAQQHAVASFPARQEAFARTYCDILMEAIKR